jgi:PAS domain S-box-containing protein
MQIRPVKSVALLATLTIVLVLVSVTSLLLGLRARELRRAEHESVNLTKLMVEQAEKKLNNADLILQGVQERLAAPYGRQLPLNSRLVQLLLHARATNQKDLSSIFLVDASGTLANSSREPSMPKLALADRAYFDSFAHGQPDETVLDGPVRNRLDNAWTLYLARRLLAQDGSFRGVIVAAINIADFEAALGSMQLDNARPLAVYLPDGTLLASVPHREQGIGVVGPELANAVLPSQPGQLLSLNQTSAGGAAQHLHIGKLADFPLLLGVTDDEEASLTPWRETAIPIGLSALLVSLCTGLVAAHLIGKLQRKEVLTEALNAANDRYQHTVDSVMDAIVAVDEQMLILLFNPAAERMFGRSAEETLGLSLDVLIPARLRGVHAHHLRQFTVPDDGLPRTVVPQRNIVGLRADGREFPMESTFSKAVVDGHVQMTAVLRDATDKRKAEVELREANSQLRELSNSLTQVREQERTRISRELHDDLGQQLAGLKLSLSWLGNRIKDGRETTTHNVDDMRHQLDGAIASVRRIAAELRPRVLDDRDFAEALTWQTREFTRHSGLEVSLSLEAGERVRDNGLATALFRIVQEALTNVVRHAQASQVCISLVEHDGQLVLAIYDDGVGFDGAVRKGGVGLVGMRERCAAIGGVFAIQSRPGEGTNVSVSIPLDQLQETETAA